MTSLYLLAAACAAYLIGSLSFAVIISRLMGLNDPRSYGSKNPGATNVLRSGNKKAAILTLLFDAIKGWAPVFVVLTWGPAHGLGVDVAACAGLAAFLGHLYPVFFGFVGGKGVATAVGVLVGINGALALASLALLPESQISLWTRYDVNSKLGLGLGVTRQSSAFTSVSNTVTLPVWIRVDTAVFYTLSKAVSVQLNVNNLLNEQYFPTAHTDNNISTAQPRSGRQRGTVGAPSLPQPLGPPSPPPLNRLAGFFIGGVDYLNKLT